MDELHFEEEEFSSKLSGKTILRIFNVAKKYKLILIGFLVFTSLASASEAVFTYIIKLAVDEGILTGNLRAFARYMYLYGTLAFTMAVWVFGVVASGGYLGERMAYDLRKSTFEHLQKLSFSYFDKTPVGWIMARVTSDTARIAELASWMLVELIWGVAGILFSMIFMFIINFKLALFVLAIVPILIYVSAKFKRFIKHEYRNVRSVNSQITGAYNENITGVRVVKALTREEENLKAFENLSHTMFRKSFRAGWLSALFLPAVQIVSAVAMSAIILYGGFQAKIGVLSIGGIQAFIFYVVFMLYPIQDLARVYSELQRAIASAERVFSLLDTNLEIEDKKDAESLTIREGRIEFDRVTFFYEEDNQVLKDFSLLVEPGETIALVGPTGGGKSTIVNLVGRFYEPRAGNIRIDGTEYREFTQESLQSHLGVVLQTPHLFSGSILENIRYGKINASEEDIKNAAQIAHAHEFIVDLENGYDEEVGELGAKLSVGQKQLISIARAILANPAIIIMDEATSSIDTVTEGLIQSGIEAMLTGCTSFVIAHRLSTIKNADRILVIDGGRIKEIGTHQELILKQGHYFGLYMRQFQRKRAKNIKILK